MSSIKDRFKGLIKEHVTSFLKEHAFRRRGTDFIKSAGECFQHIAFNFDEKSSHEGTCYYFAFLEYPRVEIHLNLGKTDFDAVNTFGKQMGYLSAFSKFEEWRLDEKTDLEVFAEKFKEHLQRYGFPFLEKYSHMNEAVKAMESGELFNLGGYDRDLRLAVMHHLLGNKETSIQILDAQIGQLSGKPRQIIPIQLKQYLQKNP